MKKIALLCATTAFVIPSVAMAQSTGTIDAENNTVVVTGTRTTSVGGVEAPDTSKTREVLNSTFIQNQTPGQSINNTINSLPGVSFTNNDPFGSAGGTLYIRGFDNTRISQTFDGIPLNDTGNYALYSNQQLDPELIEQVNVSLGSTDVDSPTAAATGSTVNYRTRRPYQDFAARIQGSYGGFDGGDFYRVFGVVDTGRFTPWGTRAFFSGSMATNDAVYGNRGVIYKQQYNGMIYQPIGSHGDFISVAAHYNQNRNNFFGSLPLRWDTTQSPTNPAPRVVGGLSTQRFPRNADERDYTVARCFTDTPQFNVVDAPTACGTAFEERYNPSNTGNIRINSRFTLADGLVLTVDPSFQYVKANGGGTATGREGTRDVNPAGGTATPTACLTTPSSATNNCQVGYWGGSPYYGRDLNGDGDLLDTVAVLAPSQTQTNRYGVIAGLRWEINDQHMIRIAYSYDRGRHRQTGETGFLQPNGEPFDVFPVNSAITGSNGSILQKRDRRSIALLNQIAGEYRGEFFDSRLTVNIGVRAPFFTRDLTNNCATSSASGFVECGTPAAIAAYIANNPTVNIGSGNTAPVQGPQNRVFHYNAVLPNIGLVYDLTPRMSVFANYSRGLQVPGTDNLYNSFFYPITTAQARPRAETTDNFDVGLRYRSSRIMAQISGWYTIFSNRTAQAYDPELDQNVFRNLGKVDKYGIDASLAWQIIPELQLYVYGSYLWSNIRDNVLAGECTVVTATCTAIGNPIFAQTAGNRESGAPIYTFGGRLQAQLGPVQLGIQAKRTGGRYVNDTNLPISLCTVAFQNVTTCTGTAYQVFPARTPAYNIVDLDIRVPLGWAGLNDDTYFQLNVTNVFDQFYVGNFSGALLGTAVPFVQVGAPRAVIGTLVVQFR
ncbi:TonB-dependent receptor [Allosphingosinicella sp.]|uniref:TonB-dependent receptor n=1 Tax=Allosphingosinicella sp. TaxID=2823234 RepID=UPI0037846C4E